MGVQIKGQNGVQSIAAVKQAPAPEPEQELTVAELNALKKKKEEEAAAEKKSAKKVPGKKEEYKIPSYDLATMIADATSKPMNRNLILHGNEVPNIDRIPTTIFELDAALLGGIVKNRINIFYGDWGSGKTNAALKTAAYVQKYFPPSCNKVVFVDLEHAYDKKWATALGVDVSALIVIQPRYGEEATDLITKCMRASDCALVIVDSVAAMVAIREVEGSVEKADVGSNPLLIKRLVNKIVVLQSEQEQIGHGITTILINQRRFKVGIVYGDPESMPGGEAQKFLSMLTLRFAPTSAKENEDASINPMRPPWKGTNVKVKKPKIPVFAFDITYKMAVLPCDDVPVGGTDSFKPVSGYLKANGMLVKDTRPAPVLADDGNGYKMIPGTNKPIMIATEGWWFQDVVHHKLEQHYDQYYSDDAYRIRMQKAVTDHMAGHKDAIVLEGLDTTPIDDEAPPNPMTEAIEKKIKG